MILDPLRIRSQITDAIDGFTPPELEEKIQAVRQHLSAITHINGKRAFNIVLDGDTVLFSLRAKSKTRYYYPVQYARIQIS